MKKALLAALVVASGIWFYLHGKGEAPSPARQLAFDRIWIDHFPRSDTDMAQVFVALSDEAVGIFNAASQWKGEFEIFHWEPRGEGEMVLLYPQTHSRETVKYRATECDAGEFTFCLELAGNSRGVKKYYSKRGWEVDSLAAARAQLTSLTKPARAP